MPKGGGKGVILAVEGRAKTTELLAAFARSVESLCGRYITAQDVGISEADIIAISQDTKYVSGLPAGKAGAGGDPGHSTAYGVFLGVKEAIKYSLGADRSEEHTSELQSLMSSSYAVLC